MISGATSSLAAIATFEDSVARYRENGEDVAAVLAAPAVVEGHGAQQVISNPLRFDLDQAALALTQLDPIGSVCAILSLCALIFFPILGFVLGVFLATHDLKSGAVIMRWPKSGLVPFVSSKPLTLIGSLAGLAVLVAALTVPAAWIARMLVATEAAKIEAFRVEAPSLPFAAVIAALAVLTGSAFGALGLLLGSVTRNRTFPVVAFAVGFLLLPLAGGGDPRDAITLAGAEVLYFAGQFRPEPLGELSPVIATAALLSGGLVAVALSVIPWLTRSRTMRSA